MYKRVNCSSGITLIALVITVIVMMILAGVAISAISGADGFFERTKSVSEQYSSSAKNEADIFEGLKELLDESNDNIKYEIDKFKEFGKTIINFNVSVEKGIKSIEVNNQKVEVTEGEKDKAFSIPIIDTNNVNIKVIKMNGEKIEKNIVLEDNTYNIYNKEQLKLFANTVNNGTTFEGKNINVMADINLDAKWDDQYNLVEGESWTPIGTETFQFAGAFNGNRHKINNIYINNETLSNQGLFHTLSQNGKITNLEVSGYISAKGEVGGIAAKNNGEIKDCTNRLTISGVAGPTAGITARNYGSVNRCINYAKIKNITTSNVAGIVGMNANTIENKAIIRECINYGEIENTGTWNCAGIAGVNGYGGYGYIYSCINKGNIVGVGNVGGITGNNGELDTGYGYIYNCYNTGQISNTKANVAIGGIVGIAAHASPLNGSSYIYNCYNRGTVNGYANSYQGSVIGMQAIGEGENVIENCYGLTGTNSKIGFGQFKTEAELKQLVDTLNSDKSQTIWSRDDNDNLNRGYPILVWQKEANIKIE